MAERWNPETELTDAQLQARFGSDESYQADPRFRGAIEDVLDALSKAELIELIDCSELPAVIAARDSHRYYGVQLKLMEQVSAGYDMREALVDEPSIKAAAVKLLRAEDAESRFAEAA